MDDYFTQRLHDLTKHSLTRPANAYEVSAITTKHSLTRPANAYEVSAITILC